jgi:hypothetical protein
MALPIMINVQDVILDYLRRRGRGKVYTSKDLAHLGSRAAIDQTLSRLARDGTLQRLARGLYYYPRTNARLDMVVSPNAEEIADALARQTGSRIAPSGALAANRLGLSTQVPAKHVYLTDGRSREVQVGTQVFAMKHVAPKELPLGNPVSAAVFQALRYLGSDSIDDTVISRLRRRLSTKQRRQLLRDARYTTGWIADIVRKIGAGDRVEEVVTDG